MNKPSISPNKSRYKQGTFVPKNPNKYAGEPPVIYRSSWEKRMMVYFDETASVLLWSSEQLVVPYISPIDNSQHKYYVDFIAKMKLRDGSTKVYAIEIKPHSQCLLPKNNKNKKKQINETQTYLINQAKWLAAEVFCNKRNITFMVLTEKDIGII